MNEKLSAFVDNELSELEERRLLAEIEHDPALRSAWDRYHLIRSALRKELEHVAPAGLLAAISGKIAVEPQRSNARALAVTVGKVVGGFAIAATVAAVAILNFPSPFAPSKESAAVAAKSSPAPTATVAAGSAPRSSAATNPLNAYLVEHSEFAPTAGMANMLPYVRTVGHDSNRSDQSE